MSGYRPTIWVIVVLSVFGCAQRPALVQRPHATGALAPLPRIDDLPEVKRTSMEPKSSDILAMPSDPTFTPASTGYRALTPQECQCFAIRNSLKADLLDAENATAADCRSSRSEAILADIRKDLAQSVRNSSAASALELFYRLAELEARADILRESEADLRNAVTRAKEARRTGIRLPVDVEELARRHLEVLAKQGETELGILRLNAAIREQTGLIGSGDRLRPTFPLVVTEETPPLIEAQEYALRSRADLRALRTAVRELDTETLPAIGSFLQSTEGLPILQRLPTPINRFLRTAQEQQAETQQRIAELLPRQTQLAELLRKREIRVLSELEQAAAAIHLHARLAGLARDRVELLRRRLDETTDRVEKGLATFLEESAQRQDWLKARADLVSEMIAWHSARMQFRAAQGRLIEECSSQTTDEGKRCYRNPDRKHDAESK